MQPDTRRQWRSATFDIPTAPRGLGHPEGDLGGGTFGEQKRNSVCAGPENKAPHLGAALHGEFVTGLAGHVKSTTSISLKNGARWSR